MDAQAKQDSARAEADGLQWYFFQGDGEYRDYEAVKWDTMRATGYSRITFNDEAHTAYATLLNPLATEGNDERVYSDETESLTWERAEELVNARA